jgi:thioredoxin-related protein
LELIFCPPIPIAFAQVFSLACISVLSFLFFLCCFLEQRNKELSYTLRLCHLHPTNGDGTHAVTFGFELSEDPSYEYPLILRVEPQSSAEGAGLQSRDILLKINDRKTKGLGYDKVKKEIEKAKRDGRLEMLVVDQETFDYCRRTKKPLKEPEMKVKHVFPKSRSSASFHKLPGGTTITSRNSVEQLSNSAINHDDSLPTYQPTAVGYRLSTPRESDSENEEDDQQSLSEQKKTSITSSQIESTRKSQPAVNFHLSTPTETQSVASTHANESPLKFNDSARAAPQQTGASSLGSQNLTAKSQATPARTSTKDSKGSKAKAIPNAINNLLHKIGHPKSSKRS